MLDHLVQSYLGKYAKSSDNADRILAYNTASQLVQLSPPAQQEASANQRLREAKRQALKVMEHLDSPIGVWRFQARGISTSPAPSRENAFTEGKNGEFFWAEVARDGEKCLCIPIALRKSSPTELTGSGSWNSGSCLYESEFTLHWQDAGTKLIEKRSGTRYKGPVPDLDRPTSLEQLKIIDEACKTMRLGSNKSPELIFERVR